MELVARELNITDHNTCVPTTCKLLTKDVLHLG